MNDAERLQNLRKLERLARLMDTAWRIPMTRMRFGLDSVVGLVPGAGDTLGLGVSLYTLLLARRLGAPTSLLLRMAANAGMDFGLGAIPLVGDLFDLFFKSNTRNLKLLTDFLVTRKS